MAAPIGEWVFMSDAILEDKLVDVWPEYPFFYDVRISQFKNRDSRVKAIEEIASKVNQSRKRISRDMVIFSTLQKLSAQLVALVCG